MCFICVLGQGSVWRSLGGMVPTPLDTPYLEEAFAETETNPEDEVSSIHYKYFNVLPNIH